MAKIGNRAHEARLTEALTELEEQGYSVVRLGGKSPDAIAVRDGRIIAVEVLHREHRHERRQKALEYSMFPFISFFLYG